MQFEYATTVVEFKSYNGEVPRPKAPDGNGWRLAGTDLLDGATQRMFYTWEREKP